MGRGAILAPFSYRLRACVRAQISMKMSKAHTLVVTMMLLAVALACSGAASAQSRSANTVLISNSLAEVSQSEFEAELLRLPPDLRPGFATNPKRVNDLLLRMLVQKSMAVQARKAKLDASPEALIRIKLEVDKLLAQVMVDSIEAQAAAEFDAAQAKFEVRAREVYTVDRARFTTPEQAQATHILFDTKKRGPDEAKKLAQDTRARIAAGADMKKLAKEISDDPSARNNDGSLGWFARKDMDPAFGEAVFTLKNPGDLSEPVLSSYGWHVIRLDGRRPATVESYEQVRDGIMAELRKRYVDEKREEAIATIRRDPKTEVNRAAVDAMAAQSTAEVDRRPLGPTPMPAGGAK